ncbi:MAG TPA: histidine kinase [Opitutaceae bacterium]|jgi:signal transduction histidine kinase|nr:histidine kinase [Opitutaceae bacterium]
MEVSADISLQTPDAAERESAKQRLYVLFQAAGWGAWLIMEMIVTFSFPEPDHPRDVTTNLSFVIMFVAVGLLLTHVLRPFMKKRQWKQLGWRQLLPRLLAASVSMSLIWVTFITGWVHVVLREPWSKNPSPVVLVTIDTFFISIVFFGWMCMYFFYHLFDRLNRSEIDRFQLMTSVKEAELRALKSQVNPHFIFNSLNSLRALIDEDPERARRAVTQLANLLRYSLQSGQLETVPFEDELEVVNDYLALEQVRHEERLRLRLDIGTDTLRLPIPPMLLQTLVENAVKYGISPSAEGGEIAIIARNEGGALRIQVSNPGEIKSIGQTRSTGVGLHNAAERLRLIFGERATLRLRSDQPATVIAEAVIPLPLHP